MKQWQPGERARALADARAKTVTSTFECDTARSIALAERFKARIENAGYVVETVPAGLHRVRITGRKP